MVDKSSNPSPSSIIANTNKSLSASASTPSATKTPPTPPPSVPPTPPPSITTESTKKPPTVSANMVINLITFLNLILKITGLVYSVIDSSFAEANRNNDDFDGGDFTDKLNVSACIVDNTIIEIVTTIIAVPDNSVSEAKIELGIFGDINIEGASISGITVNQNSTASTPTPTVTKVSQDLKFVGHAVELVNLITDTGFAISNYVKDAIDESKETTEEI